MQLPGLTQAVIGASEWFQANFVFVIIGIAGDFSVSSIINTEKGRYIFDGTLLKLPIFEAPSKVAVAQVYATLGTMIASGYYLGRFGHRRQGGE